MKIKPAHRRRRLRVIQNSLRGRGRPKINRAGCANLTLPTSVAFQSHCNHSVGHPSNGGQLERTSCRQSQGRQGYSSQDLCRSSKFEGAAEHQRHTEGAEPGFSDGDTLGALRQLRCDVESGAEADLGNSTNEDAGLLQPDGKQFDGRGRDLRQRWEETARCDRHGDIQAVGDMTGLGR